MADQFDLIVIGAGAAGLTAATVAAHRGCSVLLIEQGALIGGTSAISGGMVWMPANAKMKALGIDDDLAEVRRYLAPLVGDAGEPRLSAFLERSGEALAFLEQNTCVQLRPVAAYPDYYPDLPGSRGGARVLEPVPFDAKQMGAAFKTMRPPLAEFMLMGGMMVSREDLPHFRRFGRSARSTLRVIGLAARYLGQRMTAHRGTTLYLGNALVARLLKSAIDAGVTIRTGTSAEALLVEDGRVSGVRASCGGKTYAYRSTRGVILATGGISHDAELRSDYVTPELGMSTATVSRGDAPCGARLARPLGAALGRPDDGSGFWVPISRFSRPDSSSGYFPHTVTDRGKPGLIAVGADGRRFVNEAMSYHEFGLAQIRKGREAIPAHLICDKAFLWKYGLGRVRPFALSLRHDIESGYLCTAPTIEGLADRIGVPARTFVQTVADFNRHAAQGLDPEFGRGANAYQRHFGDPDVKPNPCVAPIARGPFYSVAVSPGDLGFAAGLNTTPLAEVTDRSGAVIPGLYACGNDMQSVMHGTYPGPGITLGPALTFGYIAAMAACG